MAGGNDDPGLARGKLPRREKCTVGEASDCGCSTIRAQDDPIGAIACRPRRFCYQLPQVGLVQPHVVIDAGADVANWKLPSRRGGQRPGFAEFDNDLV